MRRIVVCALFAFVFCLPLKIHAQDTLSTLRDELNEAEQAHADASSQATSNFFSQVDAGMNDPGTAAALFKTAGGAMPAATPVSTQHTDETESEREAREAADQANVTRLGNVIQLQCGLLHYGAIFVTDPKRQGLHDDWVNWLKTAAKLYPQAVTPPPSPQSQDQGGDQGGGDGNRKHWRNDGGNGGGNGGGGGGNGNNSNNPATPDQKDVALHDTVITKYLGFTGWGDKEQGQWAVSNLPDLYKKDVLDPSRQAPTQDTMSYWADYIAMKSADEPDASRWTSIDYPSLVFQSATDDFLMNKTADKLEVLFQLMKNNPNHPDSAEWKKRAEELYAQFSAQYKAAHGGGASSTTNSSTSSTTTTTSDSNVTVTAVSQGDATIVTTHTNTPPANPAPQ